MTTRALLVDAPEYEDPALRLPGGVRHNVPDMQDALTDGQHGVVDPADVGVVAPTEDGHDVVESVADAAEDEHDTPLIVYVTGHARVGPHSDLYLATAQSEDGDLTTWMPADDIVSAMVTDTGRSALLILDTCLSSSPGTTAPIPLATALKPLADRGVAILSSAGGPPMGFTANPASASVFTACLTSLLRSGDGRAPGQELDLPTLYRDLSAALRGSGYHRPLLYGATTPELPGPDLRKTELRGTLRRVRESLQRHALAFGADADVDVTPASDDAEVFRRQLLDSGCGFTRASTRLVQEPPSWDAVRRLIRETAPVATNLLLVYVAAAASASVVESGLDLTLTLTDNTKLALSRLVSDVHASAGGSAAGLALIVDALRETTARPGGVPSELPGRSRIMVSWAPTHDKETPDVLAPPGALTVTPLPPGPPGWAFSAPDRTIQAFDRAGPLAAWATAVDAPPGAPAVPALPGHRARLRVDDDALPTRSGETLSLTLDFTPTVPVPVGAPAGGAVDLTVRVRAARAVVRPSLFPLQLVDGVGGAAQTFHVTPDSDAAVTLDIEVMRADDGAGVQELTVELPSSAAAEDLVPGT